MGGGEVNVAYDGTFGDLSSNGDAQLFDLTNGGTFDFGLINGTDGFTAMNNVPNGPTVSPRDLFTDSVPPSTSFTNLTTPGSTVLETPDDYQTSPLFDEAMGADNPNWFSLFPEDNEAQPGAIKMERTSSNNQILVHPGGELNRQRSSTSAGSPIATPFSPVVKHSSVAGVNARRRDKPLPPIIVSEDDPVALKRARNTAAARKSRAKKVAERDGFEAQIVELQADIEYWKARALAAEGASASE